MSEPVTDVLEDSIATITMDDGKVNALSLRMLAALSAALDRAERDRAIIVLGGRPGVFSAGFELPVLVAGGADARKMLRSGFELAHRLLSFPTPIVAACGGHALAMGAFLLLSADYRIGADGAFKIGANEVAIGLTMPRAAIQICRQRLATTHFDRAVINAEIFAPGAAVAAGFLDGVAAPDKLMEIAQGAAVRHAKLNLAAHAATKIRVRDAMLGALSRAIGADDEEFAARMTGR
jgi:enoyl-CoA hydratase